MATTRRFSDIDYNDTDKFKDSIWKCTTNEGCYKTATLVGNWNESRFDVEYIAKNRPLPSQYNHYYESSHKASYKNTGKMDELPRHVKLLNGIQTEPRSFPGHQPERDLPSFKPSYSDLESTSMAAYKPPSTLRD